jgi:hypothetical protein
VECINKNKKYSIIIDMNPEKYQEDIKKVKNLLKNEGCKVVYLFGSMAIGKIHKNSDIDIGISGLPPRNFLRYMLIWIKNCQIKLILLILIFKRIFIIF